MELQNIQTKIYEIRGQKILLDFDLAELYETETKALKQAVKRNIDRFPDDFMFELSWEEFYSLRSQIVTLENKGRGKYIKYMPFAFTEQGVAMLSSVLKSKKAVNVNISIMRAFVFIRQYALSHKDLTEKLKELETKYNKQFKDVYEAINYLLQKDKEETKTVNKSKIGFQRQNEKEQNL
jgi:hypothetical protein